jgi:hypothetical protein
MSNIIKIPISFTQKWAKHCFLSCVTISFFLLIFFSYHAINANKDALSNLEENIKRLEKKHLTEGSSRRKLKRLHQEIYEAKKKEHTYQLVSVMLSCFFISIIAVMFFKINSLTNKLENRDS